MRRARLFPAAAGWLLAAALLVGCQDQGALPLAEQGRRTYQANCIACHNPDPTREGTLGPAVQCASRELLEARVLRGEYPPGYAPRRDSKLMPAQPFLRGELPGLVAYLTCAQDGAEPGAGAGDRPGPEAAGP